MKTLPVTKTTATETECRHHWLLGQPVNGVIGATCRLCGGSRSYPAVLDDLDPPAQVEDVKSPATSAATAAGGARPSSGALAALE